MDHSHITQLLYQGEATSNSYTPLKVRVMVKLREREEGPQNWQN